MSCSPLYAPVRWLLRQPTLGHAVMHPTATKGHGLELRCADCRRTWPVAVDFTPSPTFSHRHWLATIKGVGRVIPFQRRAS